MKHYEIRTNCDEIIGTGTTVEDAVNAALHNISVDDFIDYGTYCKEVTENIESFSMFDLYDIATEVNGKEEIMEKQFKDNRELDIFIKTYVKEHYDMSDNYFVTNFGLLPDASSYMTIEEQMKLVIDSGYSLENLRAGIDSKYMNVYDELKGV